MTALDDARAHLAKSREFLTAAELDLDLGLLNAATSNAVTSGINAKDATCLLLTGITAKTDNHSNAIAELKAAGANGPHGPATKQMATALSRLLRLKNRSQYQSVDVMRADAAKAVEWAQKMFDAAAEILRS